MTEIAKANATGDGVRTRQLRAQGLVRFDFLDGVLPGRANPTDIDQALERNGHFLFIECKRPGQHVSGGQRIFFERLVAGPKSIRLITVEGHPPDELTGYAVWGNAVTPASTTEVCTYVRAWYDAASASRAVAA